MGFSLQVYGSMELVLACDHGGFELKEEIKAHLARRKIMSTDFGTHSPESVDYPDYALKAAQWVAKKEGRKGILVCGTGIGMGIAANKVKGVYAARVNSAEEARLCREHNNANMVCLGGRVLDRETAYAIVDAFLHTPFSSEERHQRRVDKISLSEQG